MDKPNFILVCPNCGKISRFVLNVSASNVTPSTSIGKENQVVNRLTFHCPICRFQSVFELLH